MFLAGKVSLLFCCLQFFRQWKFSVFSYPSTYQIQICSSACQASCCCWVQLISTANPWCGGAFGPGCPLERGECPPDPPSGKGTQEGHRERERENVLVSRLSLDHRRRPLSCRCPSRNQDLNNRKKQRKLKRREFVHRRHRHRPPGSGEALHASTSMRLRRGSRRGWREQEGS